MANRSSTQHPEPGKARKLQASGRPEAKRNQVAKRKQAAIRKLVAERLERPNTPTRSTKAAQASQAATGNCPADANSQEKGPTRPPALNRRRHSSKYKLHCTLFNKFKEFHIVGGGKCG